MKLRNIIGAGLWALCVAGLASVALGAGANQQFTIQDGTGNHPTYYYDFSGTGIGPFVPVYVQEDALGNPLDSTHPLYVSPVSGAVFPVGGSYFTNVAGSTLTRASNTTAYAANETVCLLASVTPCAPITISIANTTAGKGLINRVSLLKSGPSTTNASFTIWLFSAAPGTSTPSQFDATSYTGPRAADMPNYIGNATCATPTVTSDTTAQVWYDCALSNPNTGGALDFQALAGLTSINALISVTAAYTPASAETFIPYVSGIY